MKSLSELSKLYASRADAALKKHAAPPAKEEAPRRTVNSLPPMPDKKPLFGDPSSIKKNVLDGKPQPAAALSPEEIREQDSRIMEMYKKREEMKEKQKRIEQNKRDSAESEVENAERASAEKIREVVAIHPEFASIMAFVEFLNENQRDAFSRVQFELLCSLHALKSDDLMTVLNAAGKFELRGDRKVRTPSEVIQEAADQLGTNRQEVFQFLHNAFKTPEEMPLSVAAVIKAFKNKGLSEHEIRVRDLREKQNRNKADDGDVGNAPIDLNDADDNFVLDFEDEDEAEETV